MFRKGDSGLKYSIERTKATAGNGKKVKKIAGSWVK
jgi:hypothetical protein